MRACTSAGIPLSTILLADRVLHFVQKLVEDFLLRG